MTLEGTDKVVVIGNEVDSVQLARSLKKKFGYVMLVSVQEEKAKEDQDKEEKETTPGLLYGYVQCPQLPVCEVLYDTSPTTTCSILLDQNLRDEPHVQLLASRDWVVHFKHTYREEIK